MEYIHEKTQYYTRGTNGRQHAAVTDCVFKYSNVMEI